MTSRKDQLMQQLLDYLLTTGVCDLSLRPMAAAVGTSARLLLFHFGSKENLLMEVLAEMQDRLQKSFARLSTKTHSAPLLRVFWDWGLQRENFGYLRVLYQLHILAAQDSQTYGRYLKTNSVNWLHMIEQALPKSHQNAAMATLFGAVFDGLFLELMSTGERKRTTRALDQFVLLIRSQIQTAPARKKSATR